MHNNPQKAQPKKKAQERAKAAAGAAPAKRRLAGRVLLGAVIGAHGIKGEVKVKTFTAAPDALAAYGALHTDDGRTLSITAFRTGKAGRGDVRFEGIADRNAAEALKGTELSVSRTALPAPDEDEFYHADLIGLEVARSRRPCCWARYAALHNFGAGDVMEIETPDGRHRIHPLQPRDRAQGRDRRTASSSIRPMTRNCVTNSWRASVLTLFPEMFPGPLGISLMGKALERWALVARCARHPRPWPGQAPHGGRHARRAAAPAW